MPRAITLSTLFALTLGAALPAMAHTPPRPYNPKMELDRAPKRLPRTSVAMRFRMNVQRRMAKQLERIYGGILDGSLTWRESSKLFPAQERIERKLYKALRDGRLRPYERRRITSMQNRESRRIGVMRHNRLTRRFAMRRFRNNKRLQRNMNLGKPLPKIKRRPRLNKPVKVFKSPTEARRAVIIGI